MQDKHSKDILIQALKIEININLNLKLAIYN